MFRVLSPWVEAHGFCTIRSCFECLVAVEPSLSIQFRSQNQERERDRQQVKNEKLEIRGRKEEVR